MDNIITSNICQAYKLNKTQCTRKRKNGELYCGTHMKNAQNGSVFDTTDYNPPPIKIKQTTKCVYEHTINNIVYFIDDVNNVYNTEDVMMEIRNPRIIGTHDNGNIIYVPNVL